ncbi:hypothetical protein FSP39_004642 [Pinctada imbricata]|uniref:Kazal-like domain-containing protein n=1 Tax=Pinctada imbricata TaxID=66713 RepID=A0AA89C6H3_PINIB|nr:hypothetical protein FSP39_004642 [Pinctada imbricata]
MIILTESNPCRGITCPYGDCVIDRNNNPVCKCLPKCEPVVKPVCGSNGMNFDNECKLRQYACTNKIKDLGVLKEGNCAGEGCGTVKKCEYFSFCNGTGHDAACICPTNMSCEYQTEAPVCGNDSKEYHNECFLRVASCKQKKTIYIKSHGQCDLCSGQVCRFGSHCVNGQCVCPRYCESGGDLVCASDGGRYRNRCEMRKAACEQKTTLYEDLCKDEPNVNPSEGSGDGSGEGSGDEEEAGSGDGETEDGDGEKVESLILCDSSICPYGGYCQIRKGKVECICDLDCDAVRAPVCGSDGKTYGNLCEMKEEACRTKRKIQEIPMENCNDIAEEPCDGESPLVDPSTGMDYNCAVWHGVCPPRSYCHLQYGKCCAEGKY